MDEFIDVTKDAKTARVLAADREAIAAALFGDAPLEPLFLGGRGRVYRFQTVLGPGILRPYRRGGFIRHFIHDRYWRVNRPLRELEILRAAYDAGLPVPRPLGAVWEEHRGFYTGSIATVQIQGKNLLAYLANEPANREEVLKRCGDAIRRIHDAGIIHADLQVENLFVGIDGVYVLDFDKAQRVAQLSERQRMRNLERLAYSMLKRGLYDDALGIYAGYAGKAIVRPSGGRSAVTVEHVPGEWSSSRRRIEVPHGAEAVCTPGIVWAEILDALNQPGIVVKAASTWTTRRIESMIVKEFRAQSLVDYLGQFRDGARFRRAWEISAYLAARGVWVPRAIAYIEKRVCGFVTYSATVTEYLDGFVNVEEAARTIGGDPERASQFLRGLADAVNSLTKIGAYHADLSGKNILTDTHKRFVFIDLDSVHLHIPYTENLRLKNHVQLYDSFCDLWNDSLLGPFIKLMLPMGYDVEEWLTKVMMGQRERRARQEARWRSQGKR